MLDLQLPSRLLKFYAIAIRKVLTKDYPDNKKKWSVMGQSFGGFCSLNYLSMHPEGLCEVFTIGGLPPLVKQPDDVYRRLIKKVEERSRAYYFKYPEDISRVKQIAHRLSLKDVRAVSGGRFSLSKLRQLGLCFGAHGGIDVVHEIIFQLANDLETFDEFTRPTMQKFENLLPFDTGILYALLHEPIYCSG